MAYIDHYRLVDDLLPHLDASVPALADPFLASRYTGLLALSSATVLELCVKEILITHADAISPVFGNYVAKSYERLNGRIKIRAIKEEHLAKFGEKYISYFSRLAKSADTAYVRSTGRSPIQSWNNLITWRHGFAHEGVVPVNATYTEAKQAYLDSKIVVNCLARTLSTVR